MTHNPHRTLLVVLVAGLALLALAGGRTTGVSDADKRKASYALLQAQVYSIDDVDDAYFELSRYAYITDTTNTTAAFHLAQCMLAINGRPVEYYDSALALMKKHFVAHPEDYYENIYYCNVCLETKHLDEAVSALERLCRTAPDKLEPLAGLADAYMQQGRYRESLRVLDSIECHFSANDFVLNKRLSNFAALNDTIGAIALMHRHIDSEPGRAKPLIDMARVMGYFGYADSAFHYLEAAQLAEPDDGVVDVAKLAYYQSVNDTTAYDNQMRVVMTNDNLDFDFKRELCVSYFYQHASAGDGSINKVGSVIETLIDEQPHDAVLRRIYSDYFFLVNNRAKALEQLQYAVDIDPTDVDHWRRLIGLNIYFDNDSAALETCKRAVELMPDEMLFRRLLADCYSTTRDYDKAITTIQEAIALADTIGTDDEALSNLYTELGDVYNEMEADTAKIYQAYRKALELNPVNYEAMNNLAYEITVKGGDMKSAEDMARMASVFNPDNSNFHDTYAWALYKNGKYEMALDEMETAIKVLKSGNTTDNDAADGNADTDEPAEDQENWVYYDHYGDILEANGKHAEAVEQWRHALKLNPEEASVKHKLQQ